MIFEWRAFDHSTCSSTKCWSYGDVDVDAAGGDDPPAVDAVLARLRKRDELVVTVVVGEVERCRQLHCGERDLACPLQLLDEGSELALPRIC